MKKTREYFQYLYRFRYFWIYLVRCDLIARYRRSKLGMLWIIISPLLLTLIISLVFGTVFHQPMKEYAPYIMVGMITWDIISVCFVANGITFISAESYIRQFDHPVSMYTFKSTVVSMVNFTIALIGLLIWSIFINPLNMILGIVTLPLTMALLFLLGWSLTTISSFLNTKFRDYPQMMALVMQTLWYMSPVFFQESMFDGNPILRTWFGLNPITHLLYLLRKPFLYGQIPSAADYGFTLLLVLICGVIAIGINKQNSKKVIFYL